jgi:hypothetical protein
LWWTTGLRDAWWALMGSRTSRTGSHGSSPSHRRQPTPAPSPAGAIRVRAGLDAGVCGQIEAYPPIRPRCRLQARGGASCSGIRRTAYWGVEEFVTGLFYRTPVERGDVDLFLVVRDGSTHGFSLDWLGSDEKMRIFSCAEGRTYRTDLNLRRTSGLGPSARRTTVVFASKG